MEGLEPGTPPHPSSNCGGGRGGGRGPAEATGSFWLPRPSQRGPRTGQHLGGKRERKRVNPHTHPQKSPRTLPSVGQRFICLQQSASSQFVAFVIKKDLELREHGPGSCPSHRVPPTAAPCSPPAGSRSRGPREHPGGLPSPGLGAAGTPEPGAGGRRYVEYLDRKAVLFLVS